MDKICKECGNINESDYKYCKHCGAVLPDDAPQTEQSAYNTYNGYQQAPKTNAAYGYQSAANCTDIDGVPTEELVRFVGKNSNSIIPKWISMHMSRSRVSWCWPVFVLTMFFGMCGAAFWFLYRRMYKWGIALLAASLLLGIVQTAVLSESTTSFISDCYDAAMTYEQTMDDVRYEEDINKIIEKGDFFAILIYSVAFGALQTAFAVLISIFSMSIYKNYAVRKIRSYGRPLSDMELYLAGGTSGGAVAVGAVIYYMLNSVISFVSMLLLFSAIL